MQRECVWCWESLRYEERERRERKARGEGSRAAVRCLAKCLVCWRTGGRKAVAAAASELTGGRCAVTRCRCIGTCTLRVPRWVTAAQVQAVQAVLTLYSLRTGTSRPCRLASCQLKPSPACQTFQSQTSMPAERLETPSNQDDLCPADAVKICPTCSHHSLLRMLPLKHTRSRTSHCCR